MIMPLFAAYIYTIRYVSMFSFTLLPPLVAAAAVFS